MSSTCSATRPAARRTGKGGRSRIGPHVGNHRGSHKGHSFVLVSPDGEIRWRADYGYGGAPDYTMYLPVDNLLADLRTGISGENTA